MTNLKKSIAIKLYRANCPEPVKLGEFHLSMLPAGQTRQIEAHLKECPLCTLEIAGLRTYLDDLEPESGLNLGERLQTWIARLRQDLSIGGAPVLGFALRGEENHILVYQAGDAQLNLEVLPDPQQPGLRTLVGLLIGNIMEGIQVLLLQNASQVATTQLDELGNFILPEISPGVYSMILRGPGFEILIETLEIPS